MCVDIYIYILIFLGVLRKDILCAPVAHTHDSKCTLIDYFSFQISVQLVSVCIPISLYFMSMMSMYVIVPQCNAQQKWRSHSQLDKY